MATKTKPATKSAQVKTDLAEAVKKVDYISTVGRRKTSVARVRLFSGIGDNLINGLSVAQYFPGATKERTFLSPFQTIDAIGKFHVTVLVEGGGHQSQVQAVAHGISRALVKFDENSKSPLRNKGLLTRDPRMRERRKAGYAQSARARKQSPKR